MNAAVQRRDIGWQRNAITKAAVWLQRRTSFCPCWFVSDQDNSKCCQRILMKIFGGFGCASSNKELDVVGNPNHDADPWNFEKNFTTAEEWKLFWRLVKKLSYTFLEDWDFQTLNTPGSRQPVGAWKKIVLPSSIFDPSLCHLWLMGNLQMEECDNLWESKHTLILPTYFPGLKTPNPQDLGSWLWRRFAVP